MNRLVVGFLAILLSAGAAHAQVTEMRYALISGTASAPVTGQCTKGYSNQCITGSCSCVTVTGATVGPVSTCATASTTGCPILAGKGTADLYLTFDDGLVMPGAATGENAECVPFFGIAKLTTTRAHGTISVKEKLNVTGVSCEPTTSGAKTVLGGFGVAVETNGGTGFGKIRGFYPSPAAGPISLTLHGPITQ